MAERSRKIYQFHPECGPFTKPDVTILARGIAGVKYVPEVGMHVVTPALILQSDEGRSRLGIGLQLPDNQVYAQLTSWAVPIQLWRGMRLLEHVSDISPLTFEASVHAMAKKRNGSEMEAIKDEKLIQKVGGFDKFDNIRRHLLTQAPSTEKLASILTAGTNAGIDFVTGELIYEIAQGTIESTPQIMGIIENLNKRIAKAKEEKEALNIPLPPEQSLAGLLRSFKIENLIAGPPLGGYGMDWGIVDPIMIERSVRQSGDTGSLLFHVSELEKTMQETDDTRVIHPVITTDSGDICTLIRAVYTDGKMRIIADIRKAEGVHEERSFGMEEFKKYTKGHSE